MILKGEMESLLHLTETTKYQILENITLDDAKKIVEEAEGFGLLHIGKNRDVKELSNLVNFYSFLSYLNGGRDTLIPTVINRHHLVIQPNRIPGNYICY